MARYHRVRWNRSVGGNICVFAFIGIFAALMVLPLIYAISSSLKPSWNRFDEFLGTEPADLHRYCGTASCPPCFARDYSTLTLNR